MLLRGQAGQIIGILLVLSPEPIANPHVAKSIVQLFAARAAGANSNGKKAKMPYETVSSAIERSWKMLMI